MAFRKDMLVCISVSVYTVTDKKKKKKTKKTNKQKKQTQKTYEYSCKSRLQDRLIVFGISTQESPAFIGEALADLKTN